jgi:hypothetical protein
MALLVPAIGEVESLRYLIGANNHVPDLQDTSPRNLILKLYSSNTTPADGDVPSRTKYYEPFAGNVDAASCGYGTAPVTGYPNCINNRGDQDYTQAYGILLNGSRWVLRRTGTGGTTVTATYPEQTFTFSGDIAADTNADYIYGYYLSRANNMPVELLGVQDAATVGFGTTVSKTDVTGVIGSRSFTINTGGVDDITVGMAVTHLAITGNTVGIATTAQVVGVDRATGTVYIDSPLLANIQVATGSTVNFQFSKVVTAVNHGLQLGDVIYIEGNQSGTTTGANWGITSSTYTVHKLNGNREFFTTPAIHGTGTATLLNSVFYAERFTNGPYRIQNPGDEIKVTLNVTLE